MPSRRAPRIGRYELIGLLATGGMAEVYLAMSGELSGFRTLAVVKRVLPHLSSNSEFIKMFFDEARIAAQLDHPNIARIVEVGQDGDEYFLAMEVVQGRPLSALMRRARKLEQPLTHAQAAFVIAQAGKGLSYAHNLTDGNGRHLGVVHRDVSPQNILVSFEGAVKVIDFGVARALGRLTETIPGGLKGKIQYMSPEQASGGKVDRRSDVFALGVVLWEALCGRRLFRRDSELETLRAIVHEAIPSPSKVGRISPRLERIVMQALERDPEDRFQTAEEMALELERHAFTTAGFSPAQLATAMKALFASDFSRWRRTVAAAMDLGSTPEEWGDTSGTFLRPPSIELRSRGTIALHPVVNLQETGPQTAPTRERRSDSKSAQSDFTLPDLPPRAQRRWFVGGALALLATLGMGALAFTRMRPVVTTSRSAAAEMSSGSRAASPPSAPPGREVALHPSAAWPATGAVAPLTPPAGTSPVASTEGAPPSPASVVPPALAPAPALAVETPVLAPDSAAANRSGGKPKEDAMRAAWLGAESHPHTPTAKAPPKAVASSRLEGRTATKAAAPSVIVDPWARRPASVPAAPARAVPGPAPAAAATCSVRFGTQPWAEVWIDGKNTGVHTPYSGNVPCGSHKVMFKRRDLGLTKTYTFQARAGEPLRQWFPFEP